METTLKMLSYNNEALNIFCLSDNDICGDDTTSIFEQNVDYFDLIKLGLIQISTLKFQLINGLVVMRTFDEGGHEAASYYLQKDGMLQLYNEVVYDAGIFNKNTLSVVRYDEDENMVMRYQVLDEKGFDFVGESLPFQEAISFVNNY